MQRWRQSHETWWKTKPKHCCNKTNNYDEKFVHGFSIFVMYTVHFRECLSIWVNKCILTFWLPGIMLKALWIAGELQGCWSSLQQINFNHHRCSSEHCVSAAVRVLAERVTVTNEHTPQSMPCTNCSLDSGTINWLVVQTVWITWLSLQFSMNIDNMMHRILWIWTVDDVWGTFA